MNEFQETFCGFSIYLIKTFGTMSIYKRKGYRQLNVPKYVIFNTSGKAMEEFRNLRKAERWAKQNQNG